MSRVLSFACVFAVSTALGLAALPTEARSKHKPAAAKRADGLAAAIAGTWRDPANTARDRYRHPAETLRFFGVKPGDTVIEITPGGGWYTEILAPWLRDSGQYIAAHGDPAALAEGKPRDSAEAWRKTFTGKYSAAPFDRVKLQGFDPKAPSFGPDGAADAVLTFRNVHNWVAGGTAQSFFDGFFRALKPGGVLGVVDHRAKPGTDLETMKKSGYLTEALVIDYATKAGFVLEARSQVNANAKDSADHPNGVWTLPPTNKHDAADDAKYKAIGESDRMTLRFRKPRK